MGSCLLNFREGGLSIIESLQTKNGSVSVSCFQLLQWRCSYCKLNLPDIFASIESPHRQTNKVKILAVVGFPKRRYSIFNVFIAYVMCP